jgi:hypothetical protein
LSSTTALASRELESAGPAKRSIATTIAVVSTFLLLVAGVAMFSRSLAGGTILILLTVEAIIVVVAIHVVRIMVVIVLIIPVKHALALLEMSCYVVDPVLSRFETMRAEAASARKASLGLDE